MTTPALSSSPSLDGPPPCALAIQADPADAFQHHVKKVVDGEKEWPSSDGLDAAEVELQRRRLVRELFDGVELVDLVGHSTPTHCYLRLGDWVLCPVEAARFASYLPASVKIVRLIGCRTASTEEGRAAIEAFTRHGRSAYGTCSQVYTTHFDQDGVKQGIDAPALWGKLPDGRVSHHLPRQYQPQGTDPLGPTVILEPSDAGPHPRLPKGAWTVLAVLVRSLVRVAWLLIGGPILALVWLARGAWSLISALLGRKPPPPRPLGIDLDLPLGSFFQARSASRPGLLTDPLLTFEVAGSSKTWILEILFDFEYARCYPRDGTADERDRLYQIFATWNATPEGMLRREETPLEGWLEQAPPGVTLIQRHAEAGDRCQRVPMRRERRERGSGPAPAEARDP